MTKSPRDTLDEIDADRDEQIAENAEANKRQDAALAERADVDRVIGEQIIELHKDNLSLRETIKALEAVVAKLVPAPEPEPEPEPDPDPIPDPEMKTVPVHLVTENSSMPLSGDVSIDTPFTLCAFDSDGVTGPVSFSVNGAVVRVESQGAYCMAGGNEAPFPLMELPVGAHQIKVTAPGFDPLVFTLTIEGEEQPPVVIPPVDPSAPPKLQVGIWYPATWNIEEPYINIMHASSVEWTGADMDTQALIDGGFINEKTGLPTTLPDGRTLTSGVYFTGRDAQHWDGEWVLEWEGDADLSMLYLPQELMRKVGENRIEFTRDNAGGRTPYHAAVQVKRLASLTGIRMFRAENEADLRSGRIYNGRTIGEIAKYHIVRTMDLQETNRAAIRSVDDLTAMDSLQWSNISYTPNPVHRPRYRSAPIEAMFALAVEADNELWTHIPITLGAPVDIFDASVFSEDFGGWAGNYRREARENLPQILESPEWDRYADHFVDALIASGYPEERSLKVTVSNEVWNFSGQYFLTTQYAWGVGEGSGIAGGYNRHGYGIISARWKIALDKALKKAGRAQNIIYVIEGQAANRASTSDALQAAKAFMEGAGEDWTDHANAFGVSIASYWGSHDFNKLGIDPNDLEALENWLLNGPDNHIATLPWIMKCFTQHEAAAHSYGVPLIGAYEGGSHFNKPPEMSSDSYSTFMWGEAGGRINQAVNDTLAAKFPGIILSNYVLAGAQTDAWFEGPIGADNPMARSWEKYQKGK